MDFYPIRTTPSNFATEPFSLYLIGSGGFHRALPVCRSVRGTAPVPSPGPVLQKAVPRSTGASPGAAILVRRLTSRPESALGRQYFLSKSQRGQGGMTSTVPEAVVIESIPRR
jgi:hypothetical protein